MSCPALVITGPARASRHRADSALSWLARIPFWGLTFLVAAFVFQATLLLNLGHAPAETLLPTMAATQPAADCSLLCPEPTQGTPSIRGGIIAAATHLIAAAAPDLTTAAPQHNRGGDTAWQMIL
ncbi:hypothetical protein [Nocardia transvalensis]|uniref:hypothetical protein n=1 Tax=Nocardia transvalensis TaxID=37333 RepID=UPI001892DA8C|nr:hypothetical protein [Nocardia transvalensis]MBF6333507.1 hypothetical protein [Nocardia transvalensis]